MEYILFEGLYIAGQAATNAIKKNAKQVASNHCRHCKGHDDICGCMKGCKPKKATKCSSVWAHCIHCRGLPGMSCNCTCQPCCPANTKVHCHHNYICDNCGIRDIMGSVYLCRHCHDWGLCADCYNLGIHKHHSFYRVDWPGATPVNVPACDPNATPDVPTKMPLARGGSTTSRSITSPAATSGISNNTCQSSYPAVALTNYDRDVARYTNILMQASGQLHQATCDSCTVFPISGMRYKCNECEDFDLCSSCYNSKFHPNHAFCIYTNVNQAPVSVLSAQDAWSVNAPPCDPNAMPDVPTKMPLARGGSTTSSSITSPSATSGISNSTFHSACPAVASTNFDHDVTRYTNDLMQISGQLHQVTCDSCTVFPISGMRYKCNECEDFDLCSRCYNSKFHPNHAFCIYTNANQAPVSVLSAQDAWSVNAPPCDPNAMPDVPTKMPLARGGSTTSSSITSPSATSGISNSTFHSACPAVASTNFDRDVTRYTNDLMQISGQLHQVTCDSCTVFPISGMRYKCNECKDFDLCSSCYNLKFHPNHAFRVYTIANYAPVTVLPAQDASSVNVAPRDPNTTPDVPTKMPLAGGRSTTSNSITSPSATSGISNSTFHSACPAVASTNFDRDVTRYTNDLMQISGQLHQIMCDSCADFPISGMRYKCNECDNFDLCSSCYNGKFHPNHAFRVYTNANSAPVSVLPAQDAWSKVVLDN
jgi:5-carboxymethyl-2-hydroxymuconate isomerase